MVNQEALVSRGSRWRAALTDSATGPLIVASDVCALADCWDEYRAEAGDIDCTAWLRKTLGNTRSLAFFRRRHEAVLGLGEDVRRWMHHDVACWLWSKLADKPQLAEAKAKLRAMYRDNGKNVCSLRQTTRALRGMVDTSQRHPSSETTDEALRLALARVEILRGQVRDLGHEPMA